FSSTRRRPPTSTLFPYTTLFRSHRPDEARSGPRALQDGERRERQRLERRLGYPQQPHDPLGGELPEVLSQRQGPDRGQGLVDGRSEERRVGKQCSRRWSAEGSTR